MGMSTQTQLFAQNGKWAIKAPPPQLDTPGKRMRDRIEGAAHEMAKAWRDRLSSFKKQRQSYTPEQKHTMSELLDACNGNVSQALILLAGGQKNHQPKKLNKKRSSVTWWLVTQI